MKEKILAFIQNVKTLFSEKRHKMPKHIHKRQIIEIEKDETQLMSAHELIDNLDDTNQGYYRAQLLAHFIDMVIPVFSHWLMRIKKTEEENAHISSHIKAKEEYQAQRMIICSLIADINTMNEQALVNIESELDNPGEAIVASYMKQREQYLLKHNLIKNTPETHSEKEAHSSINLSI